LNTLFCGVKIEKQWIWLTLALFALALVSYLWMDLPLLEWLYPHRRDPSLYPVELLTDLGKSTWYIVVSLILFIYWIDRKPVWSDAALLVLSTTIVSGILVNIVKVIFGRARPQLYIDEHLYGFFWGKVDVLYRSFPSGHATTAIAVWLAFALLFPRYRIGLIAVGILIALSRVVLSQHYFSDVLVGGWLGAMTTLILYGMIFSRESAIDKR
jgi:membrane-associated phospholipid phosphatase